MRGSSHFSSETPNAKRLQLKRANKTRGRSHLSSKTPNAKRLQRLRANESAEQREQNRLKMAAYSRERRLNETPEQREQRLKEQRIRIKQKRLAKKQVEDRDRRERLLRRIVEGGSGTEDSVTQKEKKRKYKRKSKLKRGGKTAKSESQNGTFVSAENQDNESKPDNSTEPLVSTKPQDIEMVTIKIDPLSYDVQMTDEGNSINENIQ